MQEVKTVKEKITKIIHIDMDAFFASVEQRDDPTLRHKPVAVGGSSKRGVVAAASYEARAYGVHSAMSSIMAAKRCPHLIFVKPRFEVYKEVSGQIQGIFHQYTDLVEPMSLDEAYLDVTHNKVNMPSATIIAREIKDKIQKETYLTASAGISFNKFLAKMASDLDKPDGLSVILPNQAMDFIGQLPINKFHGIGKKTSEKMNGLGIFTGADLRKWSAYELNARFGKAGSYYHKIAFARDDRKVNPNRIRKSFSTEDTFEVDIYAKEEMKLALDPMIDSVFKIMKKKNIFGKTATLKIKYDDFKVITRSKTIHELITEKDTYKHLVTELLEAVELEDKGVRLLGVGISNLNTNEDPPTVFQLTIDF